MGGEGVGRGARVGEGRGRARVRGLQGEGELASELLACAKSIVWIVRGKVMKTWPRPTRCLPRS